MVERLGLQMNHIASGDIAAFDYNIEEASRFVRATVGLVVSVSTWELLKFLFMINVLDHFRTHLKPCNCQRMPFVSITRGSCCLNYHKIQVVYC